MDELQSLLHAGMDVDKLTRAREASQNIRRAIEEAGRAPAFGEQDAELAIAYFERKQLEPPSSMSTMAALAAYVAQYETALIRKPQALRNFVTNRLLELSLSAKSENIQLQALTLLGKVGAMFTDKVSVHQVIEDAATVADLKRKIAEMRQSEIITLNEKPPATDVVAKEAKAEQELIGEIKELLPK